MKSFTIHTDKNITAQEFDELMASNGWGNDGFFTEEVLSNHFSEVRHFAYVRSDTGSLVGYMSTIFNGFASMIIDTVAIHPSCSQDDIGHMLLEEIMRQSNGYPLYATPFHDQQEIFRREGFRIPGRPMVALSRW